MNARSGLWRKAWHGVAHALLALLALVSVLLLGVWLYLSSAHGRARLISVVVRDLNRVLPGKLTVGRLERLELVAVTLRDVGIRAPAGNETIVAGRVYAALELWPLLRGQIVFSEVQIDDAFVDLRFEPMSRAGIASAFVHPPSPEPTGSSSPPPPISFEQVHLARVDVRLPDPIASESLDVTISAIDAMLTVTPAFRLELQTLEAGLARGGRHLGSFGARGELAEHRLSRLELAARLSDMAIDLAATVNTAARSDWDDAPFEAQLSIEDLTSARLAQLLGLPDLGGTVLPATGVALRLSGNAQRWRASGDLENQGGRVTMDASGQELRKLDVRVQSESLRLRSVLPNLPDWRLGTSTSLGLLRVPDGSRFQLDAHSRSALNGVALPLVRLQAMLGAGKLEQIDARLETAHSHAQVRGNVSLAGSADLHAALDLDLPNLLPLLAVLGVRAPELSGRTALDVAFKRNELGRIQAQAELRSAAIGARALRVDGLVSQLSLAGELERPQLELDARWNGGRAASIDLSPGRLHFGGDPSRYTFSLEAGTPRKGSLALSGWLEHQQARTRCALRASGVLRQQRWQIDVQPVEIGPAGVHVSRADLVFAEQRATLQGDYAPHASKLLLSFDSLDLGRLSIPFVPAAALEGTLSGQLRALGTPEQPELHVHLVAKRLSHEQAPPLDAELRATLAAASGRFELAARAVETPNGSPAPARLDAHLDAKASFAAGPRWTEHWLRGSAIATLELARLDTRLLHEWLGAAPDLASELGGRASLAIEHGQPKLETELALVDARGKWLHARASFALEDLPATDSRGELADLVSSSLGAIAERARWDIALQAEPRSTEHLPLPATIIDRGASRLGLKLVLTHESHAEPNGQLQIEVSTSQGPARGLGDCTPGELALEASLGLHDGSFRAQVLARRADERLLRASTEGRFPLAPLWRGEAFAWPHFAVSIEADALRMSELPLVCRYVHGVVAAHGQLSDPLGPEPRGELSLHASEFSFGSEQTLTLDGSVRLAPAELEIATTLTSGEHASELRARLPLERQGQSWRLRPDAPVEASVAAHALPLAAFSNRNGPLSDVSGVLEGQLRVSGTTDAPKFSGQLRVQNAAFTVTAVAQPLSDVNGELAIENGVLLIRHWSGRDAGGTLGLDGRLNRGADQALLGSFDLQASKFPLRQAGQVVATTSATAHVDTNFRPGARDLRIQLRAFDTWLETESARQGLALETHPDVVIEDHGVSTRAVAPERPSSARVSIRIDASEQFSVRRADFAVQLTAALQVVVTPPTPPALEPNVNVTGQLEFARGNLELLGKMFVIQRGGLLRFSGAPEPTLDLRAIYQDRRSNKTLSVHLRGIASAPKLDFLLDDVPVTAGEALQTIYGETSKSTSASTTATTSAEGTEAEAEAKQFVSALTAGVLTASIRRRFGAMAPIVTIEPSSTESNGEVRAGFELDPLIPSFLRNIVTGVYVEGILASQKNEQTQSDVQGGLEVELYFPYNLVTSGRYGPDATWSLDVGWQP